MNCDLAVFNSFGSDQWNAEVYGSLSVASRIVSTIQTKGQAIRLAFTLRSLNKMIDSFVCDVQNAMEGKQVSAAVCSSEPTTPERARNTANALRELSAVLGRIYEDAKRQRLTNNSLVAGPLSKLNDYRDEIWEVADWLDMVVVNAAATEAIFARADSEKERGDIYDLSHVK